MMKKPKRTSALATTLGAGLLAACDPSTPSEQEVLQSLQPSPSAVSRPAEPPAPGETIASAVRDPDVFARARTLGALLPTLGPEAVPEAVAALEDPSLDPGSAGIDLLLRFWATHEPEAATRWAVEECPPVYRGPAVLSALPIWAERDPYAALAAIQAWEIRPDVREVLPIALIRGWFARDPVAVASHIGGLGVGVGRQRALATFVRTLLQQQGTEATVRWAEAVPDDDASYKLAVYRQVGAALPLFDRQAALRWCNAHCDGPYGNNLRSIIARRWVLEDGEAALEWLSTAPEGLEKRRATRRVFTMWAQRDRQATMRWMAAQSREEAGGPEAWLEPVFPVYARLLARETPVDAITWAQRIEGDEERELVLIDVARIWRAQDEAAAEAWLAESPLSEEAREKARAPARGPNRAFSG